MSSSDSIVLPERMAAPKSIPGLNIKSVLSPPTLPPALPPIMLARIMRQESDASQAEQKREEDIFKKETEQKQEEMRKTVDGRDGGIFG